MKQINFRNGNLELRTTLYPDRVPLEIVQWGDDSCWTIASWHCRNREERYDLEFVGDRPFDERIDIEDFMCLAKLGQQHLDKERTNDPTGD